MTAVDTVGAAATCRRCPGIAIVLALLADSNDRLVVRQLAFCCCHGSVTGKAGGKFPTSRRLQKPRRGRRTYICRVQHGFTRRDKQWDGFRLKVTRCDLLRFKYNGQFPHSEHTCSFNAKWGCRCNSTFYDVWPITISIVRMK